MEQDQKDQGSFSDKLSNFWYFYKWQTILATIVLIAIVIGISQCSSGVQEDAAMMYVGPSTISIKDQEAMKEVASQYMTDYTDDGIKELTFLNITIAGKSSNGALAYEFNNSAYQRFNTEIATGSTMIYIVEESFYQKLLEADILQKLSEILDVSAIPADAIDEYGVRVGSLDFFKQDGFDAFNDDMVLCLRRSPANDSIKYGATVEFWNSNKTLFKAMFLYKSPAKAN